MSGGLVPLISCRCIPLDRLTIWTYHEPYIVDALPGGLPGGGVACPVVQRHLVVGDDLGAIGQGGSADQGGIDTIAQGGAALVSKGGQAVRQPAVQLDLFGSSLVYM